MSKIDGSVVIDGVNYMRWAKITEASILEENLDNILSSLRLTKKCLNNCDIELKITSKKERR